MGGPCGEHTVWNIVTDNGMWAFIYSHFFVFFPCLPDALKVYIPKLPLSLLPLLFTVLEPCAVSGLNGLCTTGQRLCEANMLECFPLYMQTSSPMLLRCMFRSVHVRTRSYPWTPLNLETAMASVRRTCIVLAGRFLAVHSMEQNKSLNWSR